MKNYREVTMKFIVSFICFSYIFAFLYPFPISAQGKRVRDYGIKTGVLQTGPNNAVTDVKGVKVGHYTLIKGDNIRTGVTAILPHTGNIFQEKVPAAIFVANGFGKLAGYTQVEELGNIETPIILTNTLSIPTAADALIDYTFSFKENKDVRSVNPVVGETNDGWLNDIRGRHVKKEHVLAAIKNASGGGWRKELLEPEPVPPVLVLKAASEPHHVFYPEVWAVIRLGSWCKPISGAFCKLPAYLLALSLINTT